MAQGGTSRVEEFVLQAFVHLTVYLIGAGVIIAFYYNLYVLDKFISSLFWAAICSIPLFQVKLLLLSQGRRICMWFCSMKYQVVAVSPDGVVRLKLLSEAPDGMDDDQMQPEMLLELRIVDVEMLQRTKELHARGKTLHAVVTRSSSEDGIETLRCDHIFPAQHWLGILSPYESFLDCFRDLWLLGGALASLVSFAVWPLQQFFDPNAGSQPYFGLLLRLCSVHFVRKFIGWDSLLSIVLFVSLHLIVGIMVLRLLTTFFVKIGPRMVPLILRVFLGPGKHSEKLDRIWSIWEGGLEPVFRACVIVSWKVSKRLIMVLAVLLEDCHMIMGTLIILVSLLGSYMTLHWLSMSLRHEAIVIWNQVSDLLLATPSYHQLASKVKDFIQTPHEADAYLWGYGQSLVGAAAPEYQDWLQSIEDFRLLKYIFSDLWWKSSDSGEAFSMDSLASLIVQMSPKVTAEVEDNMEACALARSVGATCEPSRLLFAGEPDHEEHEPLKIVTLIQLVLGGNMSAAMELGPSAYSELVKLAPSSEDSSGGILGSVAVNAGFAALHMLTFASSILGQAVVFLTALFYLLSARTSFLEKMLHLFHFIDQDRVVADTGHKVVQAVLLSALKMSVFHALFTWLLYSWADVPIIVVPVALSALVALVPVVSPVWSVSSWATFYLLAQKQNISAFLAFVMNFSVWWQLPTVLYAEIPEANPWLTGLSVVLGINQFGVSGVVLGPMLATVPLICIKLLTRFNQRQSTAGQASRFMSFLRSGGESSSEALGSEKLRGHLFEGDGDTKGHPVAPRRLRRFQKGLKPVLHQRASSKEGVAVLSHVRPFHRKVSGHSQGADIDDQSGQMRKASSSTSTHGFKPRVRAFSAGDAGLPPSMDARGVGSKSKQPQMPSLQHQQHEQQEAEREWPDDTARANELRA